MARYTGGIDTYKCISEVRRIKNEGYSPKIIACMVLDSYNKHQRGEKLTQFERFVIGLRYSEFFVTDEIPSQENYYAADIKRVEFLKQLGLKPEEFNKLCFEVAGLR